MDKFVIQTATKLSGTIEVGGSKNCALPVLFATLLSPHRHVVNGVPRLQDMESTLKMLVHLGCAIDQRHSRSFGADWVVDATEIQKHEAPYDLVRKMRASVLCLGPILARTGYARVSLPGGCAIGARPIDLHLMALEKMGAQIEQKSGYVEARLKSGHTQLEGAHILFPIVSVGATENAVMAATLAKNETIIENAAQEPEITHLCEALITMGADISGHGSSRITIRGKPSLGAMNFRIPPDRIEAATYLIAAQMCGGEVTLKGARESEMFAVTQALRDSGAQVRSGRDSQGEETLTCTSSPEIKAVDIKTAPYPGFPTDAQAQWMALMTQATSDSVITESIFENRFMHVPELQRMGADLVVNGSSVKIKGLGRRSLHGAPVMATDLRASASLVLAGLVAKDESNVKRIYHLDRGYESMEVKLRNLGAELERLPDT